MLLIITAILFFWINNDSFLKPKHQENNNADEPKFEAVFAVIGLLAVAYLVLGNRSDEKNDKEIYQKDPNNKGHG
ncbi:MAG: PGF-CTERM sorting domain-containing protein [Patescibacteria group bacterium]|nr:PGF-CTERM sorting domain-containing protein [Patescibacteria group bacterium]